MGTDSFVTAGEAFWAIVVALVSYIVVDQLAKAILSSSWFAEFYYNHLFQLSMDAAYANGDPAKVNSSEYKAKLTQLGARRIFLRESALGYFENEVATPQLAKRLIEVLPRQGRSEIQLRMARLLVRTLELLHPENAQANGQAAKRLDLENRTKTWTRAACFLVPVMIVGGAAWLNFDRMQAELAILLSVLVWLAIAIILLLPIKQRAAYIKAITFAAGGVAGALWLYATPHLTVRQPTPVRFLNEIGLGATAISIKYPVWVTEEDFDACARTFSVELGNTPYPANTSGAVFGFDFGSSPISLRASDCHAPPSQTISSSNSTVDYYLRLHDQSPLVSYETILVTPTVRLTSTVQSKALDNLSFQMRFEHPIWSQVRQIGLALTGASAGSMIFLFLIQIGYKKLTARNS